MDFRKYPKSKQGGIWKNQNAKSEKDPGYKGHIVITEEMLKTLVVLMRNRAWPQDGEKADLGPRIGLSAWLNTSKAGEKYFNVASSVYYDPQYNHLFEEGAEQQAAPAIPEEKAEEDEDFPF